MSAVFGSSGCGTAWCCLSNTYGFMWKWTGLGFFKLVFNSQVSNEAEPWDCDHWTEEWDAGAWNDHRYGGMGGCSKILPVAFRQTIGSRGWNEFFVLCSLLRGPAQENAGDGLRNSYLCVSRTIPLSIKAYINKTDKNVHMIIFALLRVHMDKVGKGKISPWKSANTELSLASLHRARTTFIFLLSSFSALFTPICPWQKHHFLKWTSSGSPYHSSPWKTGYRELIKTEGR